QISAAHDTFPEVKSKREKKKEVNLHLNRFNIYLLPDSLKSFSYSFLTVLVSTSVGSVRFSGKQIQQATGHFF
ncbi:hypothetical protein Leryth_015020, partial [Lithospermum erythrorhizon]